MKPEASCSVPGCERRRRARGLCYMHYKRERRTGDPGPAAAQHEQPYPVCSVMGCESRSMHRTGQLLCRPHYDRLVQTGQTGGPVFRAYRVGQ